MIIIESDKKSFGIKVPTELEEITKEDITSLLRHVILPKHYVVVALVYKEKLFSVISAINNKKGINVNCIPFLAKYNEDEEAMKKYKIMDNLVIPLSSLERANYLSIQNNYLTPEFIAHYCEGDKELYNGIINGTYFNEDVKSKMDAKNLSPYCYFIDFRIVPVIDIVGGYDSDVSMAYPYKVIKSCTSC